MSPLIQDPPYVWTTGPTEDELLTEGATNDPYHAQEEERMTRFKRVLDQIQIVSIPSLASKVRQASSVESTGSKLDSSTTSSSAIIGCKLVHPPLHGSYNIVFQIHFDDGVRWMLKVPANGHRESFNHLAAQALESEAQTMRLLKHKSSIPVPAVHSFDKSSDNQIGCPYILMDYISGKPLHHVWFDAGVSLQKLKQIRARALQTIATSMAQLSLFKTARGGSLRFDETGTAVDIGPAKAVDANVMFDRFEADGQEDATDTAGAPEDDVFCEKGPNEDPMSSILFMLNRRGVRHKDSSFERGVRQCLRIFIQTMGKYMNGEGDQFVLAHPDFDMQNMLVDDDGTLVGIIDWDGVASVPHTVGALGFPKFLMRDWEPTFYNWNSAINGPQTFYGRNENSPEELLEFRVMYAQFIEMAFRATGSSMVESKELACITRSSILTGSLEMAASDPLVTPAIMSHIFTQIMRAEDQYYDETSSTSSATSSSRVSGDDEDSDDEPSDMGDAPKVDDPSNDTVQEDTSEPRPHGDRTIPCPRCIQEDLQTAATQPLVEETQAHSVEQVKTLEMTTSPSSIYLEPPAASPIGLRKARLATFTLGLGEKCYRRAAQTLYRGDSEPSDNPDYDVDPDYGTLQADPVESQVPQVVQRPLKEVEPCSGFIRDSLEWLKFKLGELQDFVIHGLDDLHTELPNPEMRMRRRHVEQTGLIADPQALAHPSNEIEHAEGCPRAKKDALFGQTELESPQTGGLAAEDVWERIALEVRNCGITTPMLKDGQQMISAWIIDNLKEKAKREKELKEDEEKAQRKAERKAAKARKHEQNVARKDRNLGLAKESEQEGAQLDPPISVIATRPELASEGVKLEDDSRDHTSGQKVGKGITVSGSEKVSAQEAKVHIDLAEPPVNHVTHSGAVAEDFKQPEAPAPKGSASEMANDLDRDALTESRTKDCGTHEPSLRQHEFISSEPEQFETTLGGQLSEGMQLASMIADAFSDTIPNVAEASMVDLVEGKVSLLKLSSNPAMALAYLQAAKGPLTEAEGASMQMDIAWRAVEISASRYEANGRPDTPGGEAGPSREAHASSPKSASTASGSSLAVTMSSHTSQDSSEVRKKESPSPSNCISQGHGVPTAEVVGGGQLGPIRESTRALVDAVRQRFAEALPASQARAFIQPAVSEKRTLGDTVESLPPAVEPEPSGRLEERHRPEKDGIGTNEEVEEVDERGCHDRGGFNANDVYFALGKGKLDKARYDRLLRGIDLLHNWTVGGW